MPTCPICNESLATEKAKDSKKHNRQKLHFPCLICGKGQSNVQELNKVYPSTNCENFIEQPLLAYQFSASTTRTEFYHHVLPYLHDPSHAWDKEVFK